ncbi:hypothetical protein DH2020_024085 [Rehmannia glutinosa]|uniref:Myb/SANT-like domain-containing protein n=1 Tax=Rehmannia glutinosa TaxID=99300 RepID=A0ABR0W8L7_REHGL
MSPLRPPMTMMKMITLQHTTPNRPLALGQIQKEKEAKTPSEDRFLNVLENFCDKTDSRLADLAKRIGFEQDTSSSRKVIFDALDKMSFLTVETKIAVATQLSNKTKELDIFFSLSESNRAVFVQMMLEGFGGEKRECRRDGRFNMVKTRNQWVKANIRGLGWTEEEEEALFEVFIGQCDRYEMLNHADVFNGIFPQVARLVSARLDKNIHVDSVKEKIQRLRIIYNQYVQFLGLPGVEFNKDTGQMKITVTYWDALEKETNMQCYFRTYGFEMLERCEGVFITKEAARIEFGPNHGYHEDEPILVDDNSSNSSSSYLSKYDSDDTDINNEIEWLNPWVFGGQPPPPAPIDNETAPNVDAGWRSLWKKS